MTYQKNKPLLILVGMILIVTLTMSASVHVWADGDGSGGGMATPSDLPASGGGLTVAVSVTSDIGKDGAAVTYEDTLTYTVQYENEGDTSTVATVTDMLPTGVDFVSATDGGQYDAGSRTVAWDAVAIAAEGSGAVELTVKVNNTAGSSIENRASIQSTGEAIVSKTAVNRVVVFDPQPQTIEEVQALIEAYEAEYERVLEESGVEAAADTPKPHWRYEVAQELMPEGYNCQLVEGDTDFGAPYYTFFLNPQARATAVGTGIFTDVGYVAAPPAASQNIDIKERFHFVGYTGYDTDYSNVAVVSDDVDHSYGSMWAKDKLDLSERFEVEMYLYMAHSTHNTTAPGPVKELGDGMTFTLHNDAKGLEAIGSDGEGLGVYGSEYYKAYTGSSNPVYVIDNAMAIEFDLYGNRYKENLFVPESNASNDHYMYDPYEAGFNDYPHDPNDKWIEVDDPNSYGHCAMIIPPSPLRKVRIMDTNHQHEFLFVKEADWKLFTATWTPKVLADGTVTGKLIYTFDGKTVEIDMGDVTAIFGDTTVYWGFTGSTGGERAVLAAAVTDWPDQNPAKSVANPDDPTVTDGSDVRVGDTLVYTISYENYKGLDTNVVVQDVLPAEVDYVFSSNGGSYDGATRTVTWNVSNVESNGVGEVTVTVTVNSSAKTTVKNRASMTVGTDNPRYSNTVTNIVVEPRPPVKSVADESGQPTDHAGVGDTLTYTISYENYNSTAADVVVTDALPSEVDYVSSSDNGSYDSDTHTVTWSFSGLGGNTQGKVTIQVKVNATAVTTIENEASMKVDGDEPKVSNTVVVKVDKKPLAILHMRQVVIGRDRSAVELPACGYFSLLNIDGMQAGYATVNSGVEEQNVPYTTYQVPTEGADSFIIECIVPQSYSYAGHVLTLTDTPHSSTQRMPGNAVADFAVWDQYECWVTLYIQPRRVLPPGYEWDIRTNDVGEISVP